MDKIRSVFHRTKSPRPQEMPIQNINAPSSSFNNVGRDQYNIGVAHIYQTTNSPPANTASAPQSCQAPFNDAPMDNLSIHFTGRKRELALIAKSFERRRNIPLRCALHGNQGVGKSQLTYSWAKSTFAANENAYIMWISATTVEKLFQGFCRLLRFINHPDQSHPDQNVRLEAARRWLEEVDTGNWLLIFDNVFPETLDFLRQHLPRVNGRGTILFTTRTRGVADAVTNTAGERHEVIEVPLLDMEEGVELFCGHFESGTMDPSSPKVKAIIKAVGSLPLAISHAAAYLKESCSNLDDVLELFQSKDKIELISWENTLSEYEHKSVTATFQSQLEDLERHNIDASHFLRVLAFFDPESIPLEMLITGAQIIFDSEPPTSINSPASASLLTLIRSPIARQKAISDLQNRCLVAYNTSSQSPTFRIHDLIQLVILENTKKSGLDQELFELAVELACAAFSQIGETFASEQWPQYELLVPHIQSLTLRQDTSDTAKGAILKANRRRGSYLSKRGRFVEAESLFESLIADTERLFGPDIGDADAFKFEVMECLAWVYIGRGRYADAEMLFKRVLESRKTRFGPEHRSTLRAMYYLADVYSRQARNDDAETLLNHALQSQESQFGLEDNDALWTMSMLAEIYNEQQRSDEAESLLTRVLHTRENMLGSEHEYTHDTRQSLAVVYTSLQRYDAAAVLFQQVLRAREKKFGSQHHETLLLMQQLARVYSSQGRNMEAEQLLVRVLAGHDKMYGLSHPFTRSTVQALVLVYETLGRVDDAAMLKQRISSSPASTVS